MALPERTRSERIRRFFLEVTIHLFWWDIFLNRTGLRVFRSAPIPRWCMLARRFRLLATEHGGLLLKLGQFLSTRVDLLPPDVIQEFVVMQDALPSVPADAIIAQLEHDSGARITDLFADFSPDPIGSASLAQVHQAQLHTGEIVAVKILRPGIHDLIDQDLAALGPAVRWLNRIRYIRSRYDLDGMLRELVTVTRSELDLALEGQRIDRFRHDFRNNPALAIPHVYWTHTNARMLTMEHVGYIKINDFAALDAAGIDRSHVARMLYEVYLQQFFITHIAHADPHPGNLFVKPLPSPAERIAGIEFKPGDDIPYVPGRPFQIVLIDFGMVAPIPHRLQAGMREYVLGVGTGDARRIVLSYIRGGLLAPDADLERLEEAHRAVFDEVGGSYLMGNLNRLNLKQVQKVLHEYSDLVYRSPIHLPSDMIFVFRAIGVLAGLTALLDPEFDAEAVTRSFVKQRLYNDWTTNWRVWHEATNPAMIGQFVADMIEHVGSTVTRPLRQDTQP